MQSYITLFFVFCALFVVILSSGYGFSRRGAPDELAIQSAHNGNSELVASVIYISI